MLIGKRGVSILFFADDETLNKVATLFGEDAVRVVEILKAVHEVTDNEIADKTQIRLNMVRKALYRLYDHSLVALRTTATRKLAGLSSTGGSNQIRWKASSETRSDVFWKNWKRGLTTRKQTSFILAKRQAADDAPSKRHLSLFSNVQPATKQ